MSVDELNTEETTGTTDELAEETSAGVVAETASVPKAASKSAKRSSKSAKDANGVPAGQNGNAHQMGTLGELPFDSLDVDGDGEPDIYFDSYMDFAVSSDEIKQRPIPTLAPSGEWPPPIFINPSATAREIFYMQHRWYSQWHYYDSKSSAAKTKYHRLQLIVAIGSVVVPVLIGFTPQDNDLRYGLDVVTIGISLMVAAAAAIETVKKYAEEWRNYRTSAEELKREKSLYDTGSGPYRRAKNPFRLFVERSEEVMAKQNGAWSALKEESTQDKAAESDNTVGVPKASIPGVDSNTSPSEAILG